MNYCLGIYYYETLTWLSSTAGDPNWPAGAGGTPRWPPRRSSATADPCTTTGTRRFSPPRTPRGSSRALRAARSSSSSARRPAKRKNDPVDGSRTAVGPWRLRRRLSVRRSWRPVGYCRRCRRQARARKTLRTNTEYNGDHGNII